MADIYSKFQSNISSCFNVMGQLHKWEKGITWKIFIIGSRVMVLVDNDVDFDDEYIF